MVIAQNCPASSEARVCLPPERFFKNSIVCEDKKLSQKVIDGTIMLQEKRFFVHYFSKKIGFNCLIQGDKFYRNLFSSGIDSNRFKASSFWFLVKNL